MGMKEKEHEIYFYNQIQDHKWFFFSRNFLNGGAYAFVK